MSTTFFASDAASMAAFDAFVGFFVWLIAIGLALFYFIATWVTVRRLGDIRDGIHEIEALLAAESRRMKRDRLARHDD